MCTCFFFVIADNQGFLYIYVVLLAAVLILISLIMIVIVRVILIRRANATLDVKSCSQHTHESPLPPGMSPPNEENEIDLATPMAIPSISKDDVNSFICFHFHFYYK